MTFNPGWDSDAGALDTFTDVRELQRQLKANGVQLVAEADEATTGPASVVAIDPDGNPILLDQHVWSGAGVVCRERCRTDPRTVGLHRAGARPTKSLTYHLRYSTFTACGKSMNTVE